MRQKLEMCRYKIKRTYVERTIKVNSHTLDDINDNMYIIIEKRFAYIGGGCSGDKKKMRRFQCIFKDVYRYDGVTREDIEKKSKRYEQLVRALVR